MKTLLLFLLLTTFAPALLQAQVPSVPEIANAVTVCPEICTIVHTTAITPITFQLGAGTTYAPAFSSYTLPLIVNCGITVDCVLLGGDAAPGVVKTLVAQQQATAYAITWHDANGKENTTNVPALVPVPVPVPTPVPTPTPPTLVTTYTCTITVLIYSDGTSTNTGSCNGVNP